MDSAHLNCFTPDRGSSWCLGRCARPGSALRRGRCQRFRPGAAIAGRTGGPNARSEEHLHIAHRGGRQGSLSGRRGAGRTRRWGFGAGVGSGWSARPGDWQRGPDWIGVEALHYFSPDMSFFISAPCWPCPCLARAAPGPLTRAFGCRLSVVLSCAISASAASPCSPACHAFICSA